MRGVLLAIPLLFPALWAASSEHVSGASLDTLVARYIDPAAGYSERDAGEVGDAVESALPASDPASVFPAGARLGAMEKAVLAVAVLEGKERNVLPPGGEAVRGDLEGGPVRYRIRLGLEYVDAPPKADPQIVSFVQVDRFDLGAAMYRELTGIHGAGRVAPPEYFGSGPHVSWRFVTRPVMGHAADLVAAGRRELSAEEAARETCFMGSCTGTGMAVEDAAPWSELEVFEDGLDDTIPLPAAVTGMLAGESGFEPVESDEPASAVAEIVIEIGLGQDSGLDAALRHGDLMDDSLRAIWRRIAVLPADAGPRLFEARAFECRRGPDYAPPGEYCP